MVHQPLSEICTISSSSSITTRRPDVVRMAAKSQVIIVCLPPHTTHVAQWLDSGPFGALKAHWKTACREYTVKNPYKSVTQYEFCQVFSKAYDNEHNYKVFVLLESIHLTDMPFYHLSRLESLTLIRVPDWHTYQCSAHRLADQTLLVKSSACQGHHCFNDGLVDSEDSHETDMTPPMELTG